MKSIRRSILRRFSFDGKEGNSDLQVDDSNSVASEISNSTPKNATAADHRPRNNSTDSGKSATKRGSISSFIFGDSKTQENSKSISNSSVGSESSGSRGDQKEQRLRAISEVPGASSAAMPSNLAENIDRPRSVSTTATTPSVPFQPNNAEAIDRPRSVSTASAGGSSKRASVSSFFKTTPPQADLTPLRAELAVKQEALKASTQQYRSLQARIQAQGTELAQLQSEVARVDALKSELEALRTLHAENESFKKTHPLKSKAVDLTAEFNAVEAAVAAQREYLTTSETKLTILELEKARVREMFLKMQAELIVEKEKKGLLSSGEYGDILEE